jgi:vancomycin resistance protein YoaR
LLHTKLRSAAVVVGLIVLGIIAALILYFFQVFNRSDHFLPGVTIAGIEVSGQSEAEASVAVERSLNNAYNTKIAFYKDDYTYSTTLGFICKPVDVNATVGEFMKQERRRDWKRKILNMDGASEVSYPINIQYNRDRLGEIAGEWVGYLQVEPQDARLEMDSRRGLIVVPGQAGRIIDQKATFKQLPQRWQDVSNDLNIAIVLEERQPAVDEESLSNMGELAQFSTWYNTGEVDRSHNLAKAAAKINTSVVLPGQIFSFNRTVGQRLVENGYRDAMVIVNGKFEPGLGGGICQVSSTIYNACLLAGLKIVERHNHALAVSYVPLGRDATVAYGVQDFRFQNNTGSPVYIRSIAGGGKLSITIYGNLDYKQKIGVSHVVDKVINFTTVHKTDASLPPGTQKVDHKGMPGYVVRSFRTYYDDNGKAVKTEQLARDSYMPLNQTIFDGPAVVQPPPAEEPPPVEPTPVPVPEPLPEEVPPSENTGGTI